MTNFTLKIADTPIRVSAIYPSTKKFCADYLTEENSAFSVEITPEDITAEREKSEHEDKIEGLPVRHFPDSYLETLALYRKIVAALVQRDILLFHGSVVAVGDEAYLFTAKSGTGKTTHTRLWLEHVPGSYVVNGDKPLLRFTENGLYACGTPWQGKEGYGCNRMVRLRAICILERDRENHIAPVTMKEALPILFQQSYRPADTAAMLKTLELIGKLGEACRLYRLGCNMEPEAALVSYEGMSHKKEKP